MREHILLRCSMACLVLCVALLVGPGCTTTGTSTTGGTKDSQASAAARMQMVQGGPAPAFSLPDLKGQSHSLSQYKGKVILLNFWATWCEPCKKEFPHFQRFHQQYGSKGLQILAVSVDDARAKGEVGPTIYRYGYQFDVLLDSEKRVVGLFNPKQHCPYSVVIDRKGDIRWRHQGYHPGDEKTMEQVILTFLKEK